MFSNNLYSPVGTPRLWPKLSDRSPTSPVKIALILSLVAHKVAIESLNGNIRVNIKKCGPPSPPATADWPTAFSRGKFPALWGVGRTRGRETRWPPANWRPSKSRAILCDRPTPEWRSAKDPKAKASAHRACVVGSRLRTSSSDSNPFHHFWGDNHRRTWKL